MRSSTIKSSDVQALLFYKRVQELPDYNSTQLWGKIGQCQRLLGNDQEMISMYEGVMQVGLKQRSMILSCVAVKVCTSDVLIVMPLTIC